MNLKCHVFIVLTIMMLLFGCESVTKNKNRKPNIIIFFTDDQGYGDLGCYGAKGFTTPHLDQLAEDGIRFTNFYVPATVCTPSRAGLLTGKYPIRVGLHEAVLFPYSENGLSPEEYSMGKMLKGSNYVTSCIGKWHLGHKPKYMPNNHGFDYFYGVPYSNDMNSHYYSRNDFQSPPLPLYRNKEVIEENPDQRYLTKRYTEEAIKRIKSRNEKPFFIYLAHNMPHTPLHVSENFDGISDAGLYGDVIMEIDWSMGQIVKTLKEEGIYDNTLIIFTSDNGPVKRVGGSSGPLRGQKAQTWEGGQRVPAIISWNKQIPGGIVCNEIVGTLDLLPTLAHIVEAELPEDLILDGDNILPLLFNPNSGKHINRPFYYYARNGKLEAVRQGEWKLHIAKSIGWNTKKEGVFSYSLYNLDNDVSETNNQTEQHPSVVDKLKTKISDFKEQLK